MPILIRLPNGQIHRFPDGTTDAEIQSALGSMQQSELVENSNFVAQAARIPGRIAGGLMSTLGTAIDAAQLDVAPDAVIGRDNFIRNLPFGDTFANAVNRAPEIGNTILAQGGKWAASGADALGLPESVGDTMRAGAQEFENDNTRARAEENRQRQAAGMSTLEQENAMLPANALGKVVTDAGRATTDFFTSDETRAQEQDLSTAWQKPGLMPTIEHIASDPFGFANVMAPAIGESMVGAGLVGRIAKTGLMGMATAEAEAAGARMLASGADDLAVTAAKSEGLIAGTVRANSIQRDVVLAEQTLQVSEMNARQSRDQIMLASEEELQRNPVYRNLALELGPDAARQELARRVFDGTFAANLPIAAATTVIPGRAGLMPVEMRLAGVTPKPGLFGATEGIKGRLGRAAVQGSKEAGGEFVQEMGDQLAGNVAGVHNATADSYTQDVPKAGVVGVAGGFTPGAISGLFTSPAAQQGASEADGLLRTAYAAAATIVPPVQQQQQQQQPPVQGEPAGASAQALTVENWTSRGGRETRVNVSDSTVEGSAGAISFEVRRDAEDRAPLQMWVTRDGKLTERGKAFTAEGEQVNLWNNGTPEQKAQVVALLRERGNHAIGSPERKGIDQQIAAVVTGPQQDAASTSANPLPNGSPIGAPSPTTSAVPPAPPPVQLDSRPAPVAAPQNLPAPLDTPAASTAQPAEPAAQPALGDLGLTTPADPLEQQLLAAGAAPVLAPRVPLMGDATGATDGQANPLETGRMDVPVQPGAATAPAPVSGDAAGAPQAGVNAPPAPVGGQSPSATDSVPAAGQGSETQASVSTLAGGQSQASQPEGVGPVNERLRTHARRLQAGITAALTASNRGRKGGSKVRVFYSAKDAIAAGFDVQDDQDGFYEPTTGTIGVIADQTDSLARGLWVALHEQSGHHGLRETFNNDAALEAELGRAGTNPIVRAVAEAMQRDRANRGRMEDALAVEEALAELEAAVKTGDWSEIKDRYGVEASDLAKSEVGGVMRRMLRAIRAALSRVAGSSSAYSNEDVMALLENSHKAGLRAKPHASARASTQPRASKTRDSRTRQSPTVMFEVAPDPSDVALTAQWNRLSSERKARVSEEIANRIVPRVAELFGTSGKFAMQSGGYEGATNPSMALEVENPTRIVEIAKALGHVLSQDSMMVVSPVEVAGTERVGVVTIELQDGIADEDVAALYDRLWEMERDGQKLIGGHTTANGKMAILNYSGIDTKTLAEMVNDHLDNQYTVRSESAYAAFPQKEDYGYASDTQQGAAAAGSSVRAGVDRLRAEASRQIGRRLGTLASTSRQGLRDRAPRAGRDARRSDAAGNRRTRGVAAPQGRGSSGEAWHGRAPRPGAVNVRGVHYSNTAGLKTLAGSKYGTNHRGAEARRLNDDAWRDDRYEVLKNRVYFYPDDSKLAARGETMVGRAAVYEQSFDNIYDSETDPRDLWDMASERSDEDGVSVGGAFEYIVHKAGYDGYRTDDMMVVIGRKAVPVTPLKTKASTRKPTINELGMYSAVEKAVLEMPLPAWKKEDGSAAGADVWAKLRTMPGVKQEELKWLGIEDFLLYPHSSQETAPPKFTREKVAEFVRNNGVNIELVLADQMAMDEDAEFNWREEADMDPSNWDGRSEDMMYEFNAQNGRRAADLWWWDWSDWIDDNQDKIQEALGEDLDAYSVEEYESDGRTYYGVIARGHEIRSEFLTEDDAQAFIEGLVDQYYSLSDIKNHPNGGMDVLIDLAREDAEAKAEEAAEREYMDEPYYTMTDRETGIEAYGNDDIGWTVRGPDGEDIADSVYSVSEVEVQARQWLIDNGMGADPSSPGAAKWGDYVTPGSHDNYREYKLTLPDNPGDPFVYDSHFDDENIVAFLRVTDRKKVAEGDPPVQAPPMPDDWARPGAAREKGITVAKLNEALADLARGERPEWVMPYVRDQHASIEEVTRIVRATLDEHQAAWERENTPTPVRRDGVPTFFIDEFQSDWHQHGRKDGYEGDGSQEEAAAKLEAAKAEFDAAQEALFNARDAAVEALVAGGVEDFHAREAVAKMRGGDIDMDVGRALGYAFANGLPNSGVTPELGATLYAYGKAAEVQQAARDKKYRLQNIPNPVPDAPFKSDGWISLGLKTAIIEAVKTGKKALAWADAQVVAERWSDRYIKAYTSQYNEKMPGIVKKLTGQTPKHMTLGGEAYPTNVVSPVEYDKQLDELGDKEQSIEDRLQALPGFPRPTTQAALQDFVAGNPEAMALQSEAQQVRNEIGALKDKYRKQRLPQGYWVIPITEEVEAKVAQGLPTFSSTRNPQTDTAAFKAWFKDSKVVDSDGKPLVVYHASTFGDFDTFDKSKQAKGMAGFGFYFTDREGSNIYTDYGQNFQADRDWQGNPKRVNVTPVFLRMENPLVVDDIAKVSAKYGKRDPGAFGQGRTYAGLSVDAQTAIQRDGYDGVIATEHVKRAKDGSYKVVEPGTKGAIAHPVYVVFEPTQVKSSLANSGAFNPASPSILASTRRTPAQAQAARTVTLNALAAQGIPQGNVTWTLDKKQRDARTTQARRVFQDRMIDARNIRDAIETATGQPLDDLLDVYQGENLMHGRAEEGIERIRRELVDPLKADMVQARRRANVSNEDVHRYLWAKHAQERNARIASINPAMPDGGSGLTNQEAQDILDTFDRAGKTAWLERIGRRVKAVRKNTLKTLLDSGQITQELHDKLDRMYQHYVPLRGKDGEGEQRIGAGRGIDVRGKPVQRALGRGSEPKDILGELVGDAERAVVQSAKAEVGRMLLRMALQFPNADVWQVEPVIIEPKFSEATGEVYLSIAQPDKETTIIVMHRGKPYSVKLVDPQLRDAVMRYGIEGWDGVAKVLGWANRWLSAVSTRFNPAFVGVNLIRDAIQGSIAIASELGGTALADAGKLYLPAMGAMWKAAKGAGDSSVPDARKSMVDWAREFAEAGGKTGYASLSDPETIQQRIEAEMASIGDLLRQRKPIMAVAQVLERSTIIHGIERANDAVENALRLAVYVHLRKSGRTQPKAAQYAKNVTINFNRRGQLTGALNALYLFFNASMQGGHRTLQLLKDPRVLTTLASMGAAQSAIALSAGMMKFEDDDETLWEQIPDYVREKAFVIPTGFSKTGDPQYIAIPMPFGFNLFTSVGGYPALLSSETWKKRQEHGPAGTLVNSFARSAIDAFSVVPLGEDAWWLPTLARMQRNFSANKDDLGNSIRSMNAQRGDGPRASAGKADTPELFRDIATALNRLGGGDEVTKPVQWLDYAPEDIEWMMSQVTGGLGSTVQQTMRAASRAGAGLELAPGDWPISSRIVGSQRRERVQQRMYYEARDRMEEGLERLRLAYAKEGLDGFESAKHDLGTAYDGVVIARYKTTNRERGYRRGDIRADEVTGRPIFVAVPGSTFDAYKQAMRAQDGYGDAIKSEYMDGEQPFAERLTDIDALQKERAAMTREFMRQWNN